MTPSSLISQQAHHLALFDKCEEPEKRYTLRVEWDDTKSNVTILMMNPSIATAINSDPTVTFMTQYVRKHFNAGSIWVVNMSPIINAKSKEINASHFKLDKVNKSLIKEAIKWSNKTFLAWGDKGGHGVKAMGKSFEALLKENADKLHCFRQSKKGNPVHRNQRHKPKIDLKYPPQKVDLNKIFK